MVMIKDKLAFIRAQQAIIITETVNDIIFEAMCLKSLMKYPKPKDKEPNSGNEIINSGRGCSVREAG